MGRFTVSGLACICAAGSLLVGAAEKQQRGWRSFGADSGCGKATASGADAVPGSESNQSSLTACKALCEAQGMVQEQGTPCTGVWYAATTGRCKLLSEQVQYTHHAKGSECLSLEAERVKVFVMLPLDTVGDKGEVKYKAQLEEMLDKMRWAGVDGFMVDVWWGLTEAKPKEYDFRAYRELFDMARAREWTVQAVASFHQCGGNVGDTCNIPLPEFVTRTPGIWYTDEGGIENREYISLFADDVKVQGRTPIQMYRDWLEAFAAEFSGDMPGLINEVMVGMGPCGELRYPSYPLDRWEFCGVGQFQAFDAHALASLRAAAERAQQPSWGSPPSTSVAGTYSSYPLENEFWTAGFKSDYGRFFLEWYSSSLKDHGKRVLSAASAALRGKASLIGKVAGIHWWYDTDSHGAEATAGYYNTNFHNAYSEMAALLADYGAAMDFTCLEMRNREQPQQCKSNPEGLVQQSIMAAAEHRIEFSGENALQRYDQVAHDKIVSYRPHLAAMTFLRLNPKLVEAENLARFRALITKLHFGRGSHSDAEAAEHASGTGPLLL